METTVEAPPGSVAATTEAAEATPPNHTIYINNLNEKIKLDDLKRALYALTSQYGTVLDIVARKSLKTRGQAFVVFRDVSSAAAALRALNGRDFFDKPMRVQFAREKSDAIAKTDGTYAERYRHRQEQRVQRRAEEERAKKAAKRRGAPSTTSASATKVAFGPGSAPSTKVAALAVPVPNSMLFVENLPAACDETALTALFVQLPGFKEAKLVPSRQGLAFVEFDSELTAGVALTSLNGFKVDQDHPMHVTYAKK